MSSRQNTNYPTSADGPAVRHNLCGTVYATHARLLPANVIALQPAKDSTKRSLHSDRGVSVSWRGATAEWRKR